MRYFDVRDHDLPQDTFVFPYVLCSRGQTGVWLGAQARSPWEPFALTCSPAKVLMSSCVFVSSLRTRRSCATFAALASIGRVRQAIRIRPASDQHPNTHVELGRTVRGRRGQAWPRCKAGATAVEAELGGSRFIRNPGGVAQTGLLQLQAHSGGDRIWADLQPCPASSRLGGERIKCLN